MPQNGQFHPFKSREARDSYLADYDRREAEWPVPCETRMVHTEQGETFVRISGPPDGPPLVILNGIWSDALMWPPAMIAAFAERYRVYQVDNPWDFGRGVNARAKTSCADYVAWLGGVLGGLGLERGVNVLGLSLGVWIAAEYAVRHPERFSKMVWMSPGGVVCSRYSLRSIPGIPKMFKAMSSPTKETVGALLDSLMEDAAYSCSAAVREEHERYVEAVAFALACFDERPVTWDTNRKFRGKELGALPMPVLYLAGENEAFGPPSKVVKWLRKVAPRIETAVFTDCGHELVTFKPREVADRVLAFLDA